MRNIENPGGERPSYPGQLLVDPVGDRMGDVSKLRRRRLINLADQAHPAGNVMQLIADPELAGRQWLDPANYQKLRAKHAEIAVADFFSTAWTTEHLGSWQRPELATAMQVRGNHHINLLRHCGTATGKGHHGNGHCIDTTFRYLNHQLRLGDCCPGHQYKQ